MGTRSNITRPSTTTKMWVMRYCFRCGLYWQGLTHDLSQARAGRVPGRGQILAGQLQPQQRPAPGRRLWQAPPAAPQGAQPPPPGILDRLRAGRRPRHVRHAHAGPVCGRDDLRTASPRAATISAANTPTPRPGTIMTAARTTTCCTPRPAPSSSTRWRPAARREARTPASPNVRRELLEKKK